MNRNRIRLTESQLHNVIKESVKKVLREWDNDPYEDADDTIYEEEVVDASLMFSNKKTGEIEGVDFSVEIEVEGWRLYDMEGGHFKRKGDFNYKEAVLDTEEAQNIISDMESRGYVLYDVEVG